jgi:DNA polymerase III sliding clamp (beta) subunit (PCNA family)
VKATVESESFAEALKTAAALTRPSGHLYAYSCVLLDAKEDVIEVTGGDGDTFIKVPVPAEVGEQGQVLVAAKVVARAAAQMEGSIDLSLTESGDLNLEAGVSNLALPAADVTAYPKVPWMMKAAEPHDLTECWAHLGLISYAAQRKNHPRYESVTFFPDGNAVAFDGNRLAACPIPEGIDTAMFSSTLAYANKVLGSEVLLYADETGVILSDGAIWMRSTIPQYERTTLPLKVPENHSLTFERAALLEAFRLIEVVKEGDHVPIRVDVEAGEMRMQARSADVGAVASAIPVEGEVPWPFGLTLSMTREALSQVEADEITLWFGDTPLKPITLHDGDVLHLIAPNKLLNP